MLFFHWTGISADIYVTHEDKVEFNVFDGDKEPTETNILPIDWVVIIDIKESSAKFVRFFVCGMLGKFKECIRVKG